jgi:hypothetical protein
MSSHIVSNRNVATTATFAATTQVHEIFFGSLTMGHRSVQPEICKIFEQSLKDNPLTADIGDWPQNGSAERSERCSVLQDKRK